MHDPYKILVSELMLQQTQVGRVVEKYKEFLLRFPDIAAAAHAPLSAIMVRKALGQLRAEGFIYKKGKRVLINDKG